MFQKAYPAAYSYAKIWFQSQGTRTFPEFFFLVRNLFFQHIDVKSTSISRKIEVYIESNFHFSVSIDVFNHFNSTNIKSKIILGV